jgi:hypothetical protein
MKQLELDALVDDLQRKPGITEQSLRAAVKARNEELNG